MARPHIESIQAQLMPWIATGADDPRPGIEVRTLSEDDKTGASSSMLRYPAGWSREGPEVVLADEEFFVLDGEIEIAGETYSISDYAFLPAGYPRDKMTSPEGAVVLTFFSATPETRPLAEYKDGYDESLLIKKTRTIDMTWDRSGGRKEQTNAGDEMEHYEAGIKFLRQDPRTKDETFLFCASPQTYPPGWKGLQETHPVVEESFIVGGEIIGPREVRAAGAYYWRPPGILHGPYGTLKGSWAFIRTIGGPLYDEWNEPEMRYSFKPEPRPQVPPELAAYGTDKWDAGTCF